MAGSRDGMWKRCVTKFPLMAVSEKLLGRLTRACRVVDLDEMAQIHNSSEEVLSSITEVEER